MFKIGVTQERLHWPILSWCDQSIVGQSNRWRQCNHLFSSWICFIKMLNHWSKHVPQLLFLGGEKNIPFQLEAWSVLGILLLGDLMVLQILFQQVWWFLNILPFQVVFSHLLLVLVDGLFSRHDVELKMWCLYWSLMCLGVLECLQSSWECCKKIHEFVEDFVKIFNLWLGEGDSIEGMWYAWFNDCIKHFKLLLNCGWQC